MQMGEVPAWAVAYLVGNEFAAAIAAGLAIYAWRRRDDPGAKSLAVLMTGASIWAATVVLRIVSRPLWLTHLWNKVMFVGIGLLVAGWMAFSLEFTGRDKYLTGRTVALLAIHPVGLVFAITIGEPYFWATLEPCLLSEKITGFCSSWGPLFWVHATYSYVILTATLFFWLQHTIRNRSVYQHQGLAVFVGALVSLFGNAIFLLGLVPQDPTPISYTITGLAFAWAIFSYRLMDLTPVAQDRIVNSINDAVVVLDREDRVTELNPAAEGLLSVDETEAIGTDATSVFAEYPGFYEQYRDVEETIDEVELAVGAETRVFELELSPIYDTHDRLAARLFVFHDITAQHRRQTDLEQQNEQLDRFASVVSHDLRNPINVARGYVNVARETGDVEPLEEVDVSFDRMEAIIEDVLTMARGGTRIDDPEPVELETVAREAWQHVDAEGTVLRIEESLALEADPERLQRVLENLMRNAIDHGGEDLTVTVGTHSVEDEAVFAETGTAGFYVADDGPGIPEEERETVLDAGYTTADGGTGLGLSIVQQIAEAHGWAVDVAESEAGGARIELTDVVPVDDVSSADGADPDPQDAKNPSGRGQTDAEDSIRQDEAQEVDWRAASDSSTIGSK